MVIFPSTNVEAGKPGSSSGNGNGRKGEEKPDGMPKQLPEEGMEGMERMCDVRGGEYKESGGKGSGRGGRYFAVQSNSWITWHGNRNGIIRTSREHRKLREMTEVQGYAGCVKSKMDRPGGESEVDFTRQKFAGTENSGEFDRNTDDVMADKPEEPIVPEVVSASPPEESRGGSELVKGPEDSRRSSGSSGP
ncbi:hypothetical protein K438DRAFT_1767602 [Mycena galopus ATCC 62051]|nr:hypothetical protein K438DRAFT_1767602 [Mycena galopus ATCC 62051]